MLFCFYCVAFTMIRTDQMVCRVYPWPFTECDQMSNLISPVISKDTVVSNSEVTKQVLL